MGRLFYDVSNEPKLNVVPAIEIPDGGPPTHDYRVGDVVRFRGSPGSEQRCTDGWLHVGDVGTVVFSPIASSRSYPVRVNWSPERNMFPMMLEEIEHVGGSNG